MSKYMKLRVAQQLRGHVAILTQIAHANKVQIPPSIEQVAVKELELFETFATVAMRIEEMMKAGELDIRIAKGVATDAEGNAIMEYIGITEFADLVGVLQTDEVPAQPSPLILPEKKKIITL